MKLNTIIQGDCLEVMKDISDKSIDMILCDLPYGTTACSWDTIIPFEPLWEQYKRIIKDNRAIVLTASQPFTTDLINSNRKWLKYELIWDKVRATQPHLSKIQPMKRHENIIIFGKDKILYNPQLVLKDNPRKSTGSYGSKDNEHKLGIGKKRMKEYLITHSYPTTILKKSNASNKGRVHPTQKPVALFEYLIKTYTNENDLVLDNCLGSGTTAVACQNIKRNFIGIEISKEYCSISNKRLAQKPLL